MFSYKGLRRFFGELVERSDVFPLAKAVDLNRAGAPRTTIMRHDVDIDIEAAVTLAEIEAEFGFRSTFFFLVGCDTYNVASAINRRHLRRLAADGFEVALHFDPLVYPEIEDGELSAQARKEADWLSEIAGQEVRSISLHNPSVHGRYPMFAEFINAYDPQYFDPESYLSDSCMSFRGKDPFKFVAQAEQRGLQILLHPFHYSEAGGGYDSCYTEFLDRFAGRIDEAMRVNPTYAEQMAGRRLLNDRR